MSSLAAALIIVLGFIVFAVSLIFVSYLIIAILVIWGILIGDK